MMKETREMFYQLKLKYPEVQAMTFFGSRIIGREHGVSEDKFFTSDLDAFIFYDNDKKVNKTIDNSRKISDDMNIDAPYPIIKDRLALPANLV